MHAAYFRVGGVHQDLPPKLIDDIEAFCDPFLKVVDDLDRLLTGNHIFKQRNVDIGVVSLEAGLGMGVLRRDGARLRRGVGFAQSPALRMLCRNGFRHSDRQEWRLLRPLTASAWKRCAIDPHHEAVHGEVAFGGGQGLVMVDDNKIAPPRRGADEALDGIADPSLQAIHRRLSCAAGEVYAAVEAPKGEFGVYLIADGSNKPYKCKIRAPGFAHLQAMDFLSRGHMLADVSAILGSIDIVFGEVDR